MTSLTSKTARTLKTLTTSSTKRKTDSLIANVYGPTVCKFWYRLYFGDHDYDLYPQEMGEQPDWNKLVDGSWTEMEPPSWWPWWLNDFDIQTALGIGFSDGHVEEFGRTWHQPWRSWAIEQGIAPGQLFCVEVPGPDVVRHGYEVVEYDEEWDAKVLEIAPMSRQSVVARWEADLRKTAQYRALHMQAAKLNAELVDRDLAKMYIQQTLYCTNHNEDWQVPTGRALTLHTTRNLHPCAPNSIGVSGRDDKGDFKQAMANFIANACKANPYLSPEVIRTLELRR